MRWGYTTEQGAGFGPPPVPLFSHPTAQSIRHLSLFSRRISSPKNTRHPYSPWTLDSTASP